MTSATAEQFHKDVAALGCLPPNVEPRATQYIGPMIEVIEKLIARGHAYRAAGEVLFDVRSMLHYGGLSGRNLDDQKAGARIAVDEHKRNAADFVLWKLSKADEPGWDSPWGRGRPGWHIECSAMSWKNLGETFDIHGGGLDLIFPHHENEIAQSTCAFGHDMMANVWMHNGFVQVEGKKMSKSDGNFVTINDLLYTEKFGGRSWPGDVLRLAMLKTHYRQPVDFTVTELEEARSQLLYWNEVLSDAQLLHWNEKFLDLDTIEFDLSDSIPIEPLYDDLNTPKMISEINQLSNFAKKNKNDLISFFECIKIIGLRNKQKPGYFHPHITAYITSGGPDDEIKLRREVFRFISASANGDQQMAASIESELNKSGFSLSKHDFGVVSVKNDTSAEFEKKINSLISLRLAARAAKNWAESDRIRDELLAQGIVLKDNKEGTTTWEVKR